mmetsp:Transcript_96794/g.270946  ORF Transcript_96794/g.270946 Transcript_96794/m.270946 type:complete len:211 (+) Transcript_96794:268-900(+)
MPNPQESDGDKSRRDNELEPSPPVKVQVDVLCAHLLVVDHREQLRVRRVPPLVPSLLGRPQRRAVEERRCGRGRRLSYLRLGASASVAGVAAGLRPRRRGRGRGRRRRLPLRRWRRWHLGGGGCVLRCKRVALLAGLAAVLVAAVPAASRVPADLVASIPAGHVYDVDAMLRPGLGGAAAHDDVAGANLWRSRASAQPRGALHGKRQAGA